MFSILSAIANTIVTLVTFIISALNSFIQLIINIPDYFQFLVNSINLLPTIIIPFAILSVSIYIVLFILGRKV